MELYMLKVMAAVRRLPFHLLPHHRVTINSTLREIVTSGLIKKRGKGYKKHYVLTQKAMEVRMSGERNIFNLLCTNVYPNLGYGTREMARVLIFGDRDMVLAKKFLYNTLYPNNTADQLRGLGKHKKKSHQVTAD